MIYQIRYPLCMLLLHAKKFDGNRELPFAQHRQTDRNGQCFLVYLAYWCNERLFHAARVIIALSFHHSMPCVFFVDG